jgi:hypothetical protein
VWKKKNQKIFLNMFIKSPPTPRGTPRREYRLAERRDRERGKSGKSPGALRVPCGLLKPLAAQETHPLRSPLRMGAAARRHAHPEREL